MRLCYFRKPKLKILLTELFKLNEIGALQRF